MGPEVEEAEAKAKAAAGVIPSLHITVRAPHGMIPWSACMARLWDRNNGNANPQTSLALGAVHDLATDAQLVAAQSGAL